MSAFIHNADGALKPVKNLGWLLRNWEMVERIEIHQPDCHRFEDWDVLMVAFLKDGRRYSATWADSTHCRNWLHRPVFEGLPLNFVGEETTC
jgi:hypothetical protein